MKMKKHHNFDFEAKRFLFDAGLNTEYFLSWAILNLMMRLSDRLKNGEKANDLLWESWNKAGSDFEDRGSSSSYYDDNIPAKSKSLSLPSAMKYGSRSIPPSPVLLAKSEVTIPRSKSDEANVGKSHGVLVRRSEDLYL